MSPQTYKIQQSTKVNDPTVHVLGLKVVWSATVQTMGASIMNIHVHCAKIWKDQRWDIIIQIWLYFLEMKGTGHSYW